MLTTTRFVFAAAIIAGGAASGLAQELPSSPAMLRTPVAIVAGSGDDAQLQYVESGAPHAPVTANAGRAGSTIPTVPLLIGSGENAQRFDIPVAQAPHTQFGSTVPAVRIQLGDVQLPTRGG